MKKEIGGFFEFSLGRDSSYHQGAIALNSGRNCLKYLIKSQNISKIYLPAYCCDSLIEPLIDEHVDHAFYDLNEYLEIISFPELKKKEKLIYINYFDLKRDFVSHLVEIYKTDLIVDNTQAFFENPHLNIDTFYSPRKYFGVSDGGLLYTKSSLNDDIEQDESLDKLNHLIGRLEKSASVYYQDYIDLEKKLNHQPIKKMSIFTKEVLSNIDYDSAAKRRRENFNILHQALNSSVPIISLNQQAVPMIYPYWVNDSRLKSKLIKHGIYTATYWLDAKKRINSCAREYIDNVIYLPIDQRYNVHDMKRIIEVLND